jgi:hypothetical protein
MFPWSSFSTCSAASPCTRLSRAPSTTGESDFHDGVRFLMDGPFSLRTRPVVSDDQDRRGSPRFRFASVSTRAVLSDPAGVSSPHASFGSLLLPSKFSPPVYRVTRLNRFTCVTARTSLCLRLAHVVTSTSPRLDCWWGGSSPCQRGNHTRWKRPASPGAPKNFSKSKSTTQP